MTYIILAQELEHLSEAELNHKFNAILNDLAHRNMAAADYPLASVDTRKHPSRHSAQTGARASRASDAGSNEKTPRFRGRFRTKLLRNPLCRLSQELLNHGKNEICIFLHLADFWNCGFD